MNAAVGDVERAVDVADVADDRHPGPVEVVLQVDDESGDGADRTVVADPYPATVGDRRAGSCRLSNEPARGDDGVTTIRPNAFRRSPLAPESRRTGMEQMEAFHVLASADRQHALQELVEREGVASVEELSRQVAARRHRVRPEKLTDREVERAHVRLVHTHFPLLTETDVISIDKNDDAIRLEDGEAVDRVLEAANELDVFSAERTLDRPQ